MTNFQFDLPNKFTLAHYHFTLEALASLHLPTFKGSALRGGFGHTFKRLVCTRSCNKECQLGNDCAYGYIFETSPPSETEVLRTFNEVPRPFIITSKNNHNSHIRPGEKLTFGLTLVGQGIKYLPYFIAVFQELGQTGLGRTRGKYRLLAVDAVSPYNGVTQPVYHADSASLWAVDATLTTTTFTTHAATLPTDHLTLNFLTPTRLKHQEHWVRQGPPFQALVKVLLGRISSLSYFHCGERFETDFRGLIDRAAHVNIVQSNTHWEDWSRFSGRQKQRIEMGGLVGQVTYEGDLRDYLPILALGELVHVGKGTVFGNGQYQIIRKEV